jgi:hypothetical protein
LRQAHVNKTKPKKNPYLPKIRNLFGVSDGSSGLFRYMLETQRHSPAVDKRDMVDPAALSYHKCSLPCIAIFSGD